MSMRTRLWVLGTAILCGALILYGVIGGLMPQLSTASTTNTLAKDAEHLNEIQRAQLTQLQKAKTDSEALQLELADLRLAIPGTAGSAEWIDELHQIETSTDTRISKFSVNVPLSNPDSSEESPNPAGDSANGSNKGETASSEQASAVSPIPISLEVSGPSRTAVTDFVRGVMIGDRLFIVRSVEIKGGSADSEGDWLGILTGSLYYAAP